MNAFVIHDSSNTEREPFVAELERRVPGLKRVEAIMRPGNPREGCTLSHLSIIEQARASNLPYVWILEDDCVLTSEFNLEDWRQTLAQAAPARVLPKGQSEGFAIVIGGAASAGQVYDSFQPSGAHLVGVGRWSGTQCWAVFETAYDSLLRIDSTKHIDVEASGLALRKALRVPFIAVQAPSYSALVDADVDYAGWFRETEARLLKVLAGEPLVTYSRSPEIEEETFEDELLLFQKRDRTVITLNKPATYLWEALRWPHTRADLRALLVEAAVTDSEAGAAQIVAMVLDDLIEHQFVRPTNQ